jgi:methionyl-tRNA synthetase
MPEKKFYITTPIYYATAKPHLGTLYSTVIADVLARWNTLQNVPTFFLTGTDEFGQKVAQAADKAGIPAQQFVDQFIPAYKNLWQKYDINYSYFMRTSAPFHQAAVQKWLKDLLDKGDIYKGAYEGWYCTPCETFLTEKDYEKGQYEPLCHSCERNTLWVSEECYFFKLSAYQEKLLQFYKQNPSFIVPKERAAEVIKFVESGLQDVSISRTTISWGIPFPDDSKHVTYVWADALNNYITGIGYGQEDKKDIFEKWWPADVQVMGKDIIRFHAIYWPAFLMASGLQLPKTLLVHGWIKVDDQKMSKSKGNSIDPYQLCDDYGADVVRYYLMRQMAITQDGNFSREDLEQKITSDLANDLGNLLQRMSTLAEKTGVTMLDPFSWSGQREIDLYQASLDMINQASIEFDRGYFHLGLGYVWKFLNGVNAYFHASEPWKVAKSDKEHFTRIMSATCHGLRTVGIMLWPVMPKKMEELFDSIGWKMTLNKNNIALAKGAWNSPFIIKKGESLFIKPEPVVKEVTVVSAQPEKPAAAPQVQLQEETIGIEDLMKVQLRVGEIVECSLVPESDKLVLMHVDFGDFGKRTILAGVAKSYAPAALQGKQAVFVVNLKPRVMLKKYESQGMMLVSTKEDGTIAITIPEGRAINGSLLK